jgi:hypothetical protein
LLNNKASAKLLCLLLITMIHPHSLNYHKTMMNKILLSLAFLFVLSGMSYAQSFRGPDKSAMDMAYFPDHFAHDRKEGQKAIIRVTYSRPMKNGREIFGSLESYGKVWRTGANEATEIKLYQDVTFGGKKIKAGAYSLFTIPGEKEWTIIFNKDLDYWGAYSYNEKNDVARITAPVTSLDTTVEAFTIQFEDKGSQQGAMWLAWDKTGVAVPFQY